MTDFRALCAELSDALQVFIPCEENSFNELLDRARAALAEPAVGPAAPSDEEQEAIEAYDSAYRKSAGMEHMGFGAVGCTDHHRAGIRAVLARWGTTLTPIPVAERLPGEGDCAKWPDETAPWQYGEPWCWQGRVVDGGWVWEQWSKSMLDSPIVNDAERPSHWLPAHALPLPAAPGATP